MGTKIYLEQAQNNPKVDADYICTLFHEVTKVT